MPSRENFDGLRVPVKIDAVEFCEIVFVAERGHVFFAAAINQVDDFGAEAFGGGDYVNGGVAGADAGDAAADGELREGRTFVGSMNSMAPTTPCRFSPGL